MQLLGREMSPQQTFVWEGMTWSPANLLLHAGFVIVAVGIVLLSAFLFKRFDPAYEGVGDGQGRLAGLQKRAQRLFGLERDLYTEEAPIEMGETSVVQLTPLDSSATGSRFGAVLSAELRLMLKGQPWWWYVVGLGIIVASLLAPQEAVTRFVLPIAWIWPILIWSSMGVREARYRTEGYVFSAAYPLRRQLPASWLAGWIVAILIGSGVLVRLILIGQWTGVLTWIIGALFIPSLALALGTWSGTSKVFEASYLFLWYTGPMQQIQQVDYMGLSPEESLAAGGPIIFTVATILLLVLAVAGRRRHLNN